MLKLKKLNNKLRGASARIRDFSGATIKHLEHHVLASLADNTPDITVIHGGCNAILEIGKLCHCHVVKDIFISSL